MKHRIPLLLACFLLALLPVMILRDYTPSNELRYLSIADEALRDGHLFAFTCQGEPYADKPPLYLWFVMLGKLLFGQHHMWFLTLFSVIPAFVIIGTMDRWVRPAVDSRNRMAAALMLMTSGLFLGLAVCVRMDMLMCMFIILALYSFWRMYTGAGDQRSNRILFALFTWLALFTKGPVGLLVPLVSVAVFLILQKKPRLIGRYCGWYTWGIIAACSACWFFLVWLEGGSEYLNNLLFHQTLDRAVDAFHHKEPFWYYLVSLWYSLAPWSLLVVGIIAVAAVRMRSSATELERFFLTVILTTLVMLSVFSSKLAVYLAPAFPFVIYLAVLLLQRTAVAWWMKVCVALPAVVWSVALPAVLVLRLNPEFAFLGGGWCVAAAAILTVSGIASLFLLRPGRIFQHSIIVLASGLLLAVFVGAMALPGLNVRLGYGVLCREASQFARQCGTSAFCTWKISRPESMDVYLGNDVRSVSVEELQAGTCAGSILMLPERKLQGDASMQDFVSGKRFRHVGEYVMVEIPSEP